MIAHFTDNVASEPASVRERSVAVIVVALLVLLIVADAPFARVRLQMTAVVPAVEAIVIFAFAIAAGILGAQNRRGGYRVLAVLGAAFASAALLRLAFLLTFPGLFAPLALAELGTRASPWFAVLAQVVFDVLALLYAVLDRREQRRPGVTGRSITPILGASALAVVVIFVAVIAGNGRLPVLVDSKTGVYSTIYARAIVPLLLALTAASTLVVLALGRRWARLSIWLAVVLVAASLDIVNDHVLAGAYFSNGWYVSRLDLVAEGLIFVVVLVGQIGVNLRRAERTGERAHALARMLAVGATATLEAMLEQIAREFDYECVFLTRIVGGECIIELSIGKNKAFPKGRHDPLERTIARHVLATRELLVVDDLGTAQWLDDPSGCAKLWSAFSVAPVFVDDALYGTVTFASIQLRAPMHALERDFMRLVGVLVGDALERAQTRKRLGELAYYDALTGLPNRVLLLDRIQTALAAAERYGGRLALHFLDLNGFKPINDIYGHTVGDEVLREVGRRLGAIVRQSDTVGRYGGDEFMVVQPNIQHVDDVTDLGARIAGAFTAPVVVGSESFSVGASIGVSLYPGDGTDAHTLITRADEAQYRIKDALRAARRSGTTSA